MRYRLVALLFAVGVVAAFPAEAFAQQHAAYYVLDGFGGVHAGGGAPTITPRPPYFGWDAAIDIEVVAGDGSPNAADGILVLDKFGGVHPGGALVADPPVGSTPYFGFDIARALAYRDSQVLYSGSVTAVGDLVTGWDRGVASASKLETGKYSVTFDRNVGYCTFFASLGYPANSNVSTGFDGIAGEISVYRNSSDTLIVVTRSSLGALSDKPFHVMVHC